MARTPGSPSTSSCFLSTSPQAVGRSRALGRGSLHRGSGGRGGEANGSDQRRLGPQKLRAWSQSHPHCLSLAPSPSRISKTEGDHGLHPLPPLAWPLHVTVHPAPPRELLDLGAHSGRRAVVWARGHLQPGNSLETSWKPPRILRREALVPQRSGLSGDAARA